MKVYYKQQIKGEGNWRMFDLIEQLF